MFHMSIKLNKDYFPTPNSRIAVSNGHTCTSCFLRSSKRIFTQRGIMLVFTLHSIWLYNTNQRNAQFSILIFNFWCLLHVSNFVGSSSGRQLYIQCGMFACIGVSSLAGRKTLSYLLEHTLLPSRTHSSTHTKTISYPLEHTLLPTRTQSPTHQTAHADACRHTTLYKQLSSWGRTHEIRNM
jgi:hypothetical protein